MSYISQYHRKVIINYDYAVNSGGNSHRHIRSVSIEELITFVKHFNSITAPFIERCKKHQLIDILILAISAVFSGAEGWEDI